MFHFSLFWEEQTLGGLIMFSTTFLCSLVVIAGLYMYTQTMEHSPTFYLVGFLDKTLLPMAPYSDVVWKSSNIRKASAPAVSIHTPTLKLDIHHEDHDLRLRAIEIKEANTYRAPMPNIVLIIADDLGYNDLSGGLGVSTPNIDSIRSSGVNFLQAYSSHATCSPARASMLTGRFPARFGFDFTAIPTLMAMAVSAPEPKTTRQALFYPDLVDEVGGFWF